MIPWFLNRGIKVFQIVSLTRVIAHITNPETYNEWDMPSILNVITWWWDRIIHRSKRESPKHVIQIGLS